MKSVKATVVIPVDAGKALNMFLDLNEMKNWWGVERGFVESKPGGCWTVTWKISEHGFGYVTSGIITELIPSKKLKIENVVYLNPEKSILGPMTIKVDVETENQNTKLTVEQSGYREGDDWDWYYNAVVDGWPFALKLLKEYCESLLKK